MDISVYEHDTAIDSRDQGGSLDMHQDSGQVALKAAQLLDAFMADYARAEGQETKITDSKGTIHYFEDENQQRQQVQGNSGELQKEEEQAVSKTYSKPEVDRLQLKKLLLESLKPGTVQWNKHLERIAKLDKEQEHELFNLTFKDGTTATANFVVGADGCWSKVRQLIAPSVVKPMYTGVTFVESRLISASASPYINSLVGQGMAFCIENNRGFIAQRNSSSDDKSSSTIRVYTAQRCDLEKAEMLTNLSSDQETLKYNLLENFNDWSPQLLEMISKSSCNLIVRPLYAFPADQEPWNTIKGVTIIGDAAHVMSIFAGAGANLAMMDALDLADCFIAEGMKKETQASFEQKMLQRSNEAAQDTINGLNACLSLEAPHSLIKLMTSF